MVDKPSRIGPLLPKSGILGYPNVLLYPISRRVTKIVVLVRQAFERKMDKVPSAKIAPLFENVYCCNFPTAVYFAQMIVAGGFLGYEKAFFQLILKLFLFVSSQPI
jgi:hypothetical protein